MPLTEDGKELLDSKPMDLPVGFRRPLTLEERMKAIIRTSVSRIAQAQGEETFDEANDLDIPDDPIDKTTPWEHEADNEEPHALVREQEIRAGVVKDVPEADRVRANEAMRKLNQGEFRKKDKPKARQPERSEEKDNEDDE